MTDVTIYHNPKCKNSCAALKRLREKGIEPAVVDYMQDPLARTDLISLLNHLRLSPRDIIRSKEAKTLGIDMTHAADLTTLITAIAKNPQIMERPIVTTSTKGKICHTAESVDALVGLA